ncbi:MAG: response regulator [Francisellaceae bacterium]|jgi:two-component system, chemotaxis family, protein-glutamate methylesterase/glutaminase|nr:response regulator [Francisellaceae bacterium]MBT6207483.1 response regulator [Francisellaceae bacterium]MBT6539660.1 response regulator [Francisellaceae bacterium]
MLKKKIRLLIVEDSSFFVKRLVSIIGTAEDIEIIGIADNGVDALDKIEELNPDVITMDITMPLLDGIEVVRRVIKRKNIPIIMLSAHTMEGASDTFDALQAGAIDFISKDVKELTHDVVIKKIRAVAKLEAVKYTTTDDKSKKLKGKNYKLVVIGASTGGPMVVESILSSLPENFAIPILVVMHMPREFVPHYVERISAKIKLPIEVLENDKVLGPSIYISPGGMNVEFRKNKCQVVKADDECIYQPNIDLAMSSAAKNFKENLLGIILTGMGGDGLNGAKDIRDNGGNVWLQSIESCAVSGMVMSIKNSGEFDRIYSDAYIGTRLIEIGD